MSKAVHANKAGFVKFSLICGASFALLSVAIGAFAAHGLKGQLSDYQLGIVETGAKYQMYHAFALIVSGLCGALYKQVSLGFISSCFTAGIICFSGSLYMLALLELRFIAFVTPVGGVLFLLGWGGFIYQVSKVAKPREASVLASKEQETKDAS